MLISCLSCHSVITTMTGRKGPFGMEVLALIDSPDRAANTRAGRGFRCRFLSTSCDVSALLWLSCLLALAFKRERYLLEWLSLKMFSSLGQVFSEHFRRPTSIGILSLDFGNRS